MTRRRGGPRQSLKGAWVVNTRGPRQARELDVLLEERGAHPVAYPCIDIAPPLDPAALDDALTRAAQGAFGWVVFTSANAVEAVQARLETLRIPTSELATTSVAAVGPGTAAAVADTLGVTAALCPEEYLGEALARELVARGARRVLVPQAERAREALVNVLTANDVEVEAVTAYRTILGSGGEDVPGLLRENLVDAVVFASPSAVDNMARRFEQEEGDWDLLTNVCIACIGPVTTAAAERRGLEVQVQPRDHTLADLVDDLDGYYGGGAWIGEPTS